MNKSNKFSHRERERQKKKTTIDLISKKDNFARAAHYFSN